MRMVSVVLGGMMTILVVITSWSIWQQKQMASEIRILDNRIAAIESETMFEEDQFRFESPVSKKEGPLPMKRSAERKLSKELMGPDSADRDGGRAVDLKALKTDLRQEMTEIVEEEQQAEREKREEERGERWREGITHSLNDFVEDYEIEPRKAEQLATLLETALSERMELRREVREQNMSYYEYRQEMKKKREHLESELENILSNEEIEAFRDAFPRRFR